MGCANTKKSAVVEKNASQPKPEEPEKTEGEDGTEVKDIEPTDEPTTTDPKADDEGNPSSD